MRRPMIVRALPTFEACEGRRLLSVSSDLDPAFGLDGRVRTDLGLDSAIAVDVRADGKILAVAYADASPEQLRLVRYGADGSLDATFGGGDGVAPLAGGIAFAAASDVAFLADGKVAIAGNGMDGDIWGQYVTRYNADGSLDTSFGDGGSWFVPLQTFDGPPGATSYGLNGAIQIAEAAGGKLIVAKARGTGFNDADLDVLRLTAGGDVDATFGTNGLVTRDLNGAVEHVKDVLVDAGGRVVLAVDAARIMTIDDGTWMLPPDAYVLRLNADGSADASFGGGDGAVVEHVSSGSIGAYQLAIDADGRILLLGETMAADRKVGFFLVRYEADGDRDAAFGGGGRVVVTPVGNNGEWFRHVLPLADGTILLSGGTVETGQTGDDGRMAFSVRRLNADGSLDATFNDGDATARFEFDGSTHSGAGAMAATADGGVIVGAQIGKRVRGNLSDVGLVKLGADDAPAGVQRAENGGKRLTAKQKAAKERAERKARRAARLEAKRAAEEKAKQARKARRAAKLAAELAKMTLPPKAATVADAARVRFSVVPVGTGVWGD